MSDKVVFSLEDIAKEVGGSVRGDPRRLVSGVTSPWSADASRITAVWEKKVLEGLPEGVPLLAPPGWIEAGRDGVEVQNPRSALAKLLSLFCKPRSFPPGIHPSAVVHPEASVDPHVYIGPLCVVESGAHLSSGAVLEAQVFVGENAEVGEGTRVEPMVVIYRDTVIGKRCLIHGGSVIGCDGFGFESLSEGGLAKIPQIGRVVVEDDVEIGAAVTIDRATMGETLIGAGTKIDDHVHVGHNARIGRNCVLVAMTGIGGSAHLENGVVMAAQSGVRDHARVGRDAKVAARAGVTKDIPPGRVVSGFPARDHREELKVQAILHRLPDLVRLLDDLKKQIDKLSEQVKGNGS